MGSVSQKPGTFLFTSESVGEGHPDKIAYVCVLWFLVLCRRQLLILLRDQVSDAILDACLAEDPLSKVRLRFLTEDFIRDSGY